MEHKKRLLITIITLSTILNIVPRTLKQVQKDLKETTFKVKMIKKECESLPSKEKKQICYQKNKDILNLLNSRLKIIKKEENALLSIEEKIKKTKKKIDAINSMIKKKCLKVAPFFRPGCFATLYSVNSPKFANLGTKLLNLEIQKSEFGKAPFGKFIVRTGEIIRSTVASPIEIGDVVEESIKTLKTAAKSTEEIKDESKNIYIQTRTIEKEKKLYERIPEYIDILDKMQLTLNKLDPITEKSKIMIEQISESFVEPYAPSKAKKIEKFADKPKKLLDSIKKKSKQTITTISSSLKEINKIVKNLKKLKTIETKQEIK